MGVGVLSTALLPTKPMRPSDPRQCMPRVPSQFTLNCVQVWEGSDEGVKGRVWGWAGPWSMLRNGPRSRVRRKSTSLVVPGVALTCLRTLSEISSDGMYIWALEFMCAVAIDYKGILSDRRSNCGDPGANRAKIVPGAA